jgi:hypothetical protein
MAQGALAMKRRGRPPTDANDQIIVDATAALMEAYALGPQRARDLAMVLLEARLVTPTKIPRGGRNPKPGSLLVGGRLPVTFKGREATIMQKTRRGKLTPRPDVVAALVSILRAKDDDLLRHALAVMKLLIPIFHGSSEIENVP